MSHDDRGQAGASGRSVPISSLVQKRQATGTESEGSSQRFPFPCNKTKTARTEVIAEPTAVSRPEAFAGEYHFSQDKMY